ncbi:hypothetical protein C8J57DRAFT_1127196 [Mycena rebaudengoi]|nr:hypothetical protein C8J57DRAFT_1127196 [Mycena rebaudengoi]
MAGAATRRRIEQGAPGWLSKRCALTAGIKRLMAENTRTKKRCPMLTKLLYRAATLQKNEPGSASLEIPKISSGNRFQQTQFQLDSSKRGTRLAIEFRKRAHAEFGMVCVSSSQSCSSECQCIIFAQFSVGASTYNSPLNEAKASA